MNVASPTLCGEYNRTAQQWGVRKLQTSFPRHGTCLWSAEPELDGESQLMSTQDKAMEKVNPIAPAVFQQAVEQADISAAYDFTKNVRLE